MKRYTLLRDLFMEVSKKYYKLIDEYVDIARQYHILYKHVEKGKKED